MDSIIQSTDTRTSLADAPWWARFASREGLPYILVIGMGWFIIGVNMSYLAALVKNQEIAIQQGEALGKKFDQHMESNVTFTRYVLCMAQATTLVEKNRCALDILR